MSAQVQTYLIVALILLISIFFVCFLIIVLLFANNKKTKILPLIPFTYDADLKRIRVSDVFSLPSLKYIVENNNLLTGLWVSQSDFISLLEEPYQKLFLSRIDHWRKGSITVKFQKRFLFNNNFQVFFQDNSKNGFVLIQIQKSIFDIAKYKKTFKNRLVDKLILDFASPSFLVSFSFPFEISADFAKNFYILYNKILPFFVKISNFSIFHFENILIMQICAKSPKMLEKIRNSYKNFAKAHNLGNFLSWVIINLDSQINYDWKIEIKKFFNLIIAKKASFLEVNSSSGQFKSIIDNKSQVQQTFNIQSHFLAHIYQFDNKNPVYSVFDLDFHSNQKIDEILKFLTQNPSYDHSQNIYKINYIIAQKLRNFPIDFGKLTFLIETEINIPETNISHIPNICYQKIVDSKLFYYLAINKPPFLFIKNLNDFTDFSDGNDIVVSSLGEYARREKVKVVFKKQDITKFNFGNKNFPLYYW
ncbi:hypothetical protein R7X80_01150 [Mesomycoplasma ovipneumoniae]|uniref:hypothetical protein n=1 Tax=Mesomycoplasma ovipneumoniae TaxID=29562 RepID=UPI0029654CDF|nr:hypothetical protein [Mesomycoplasma ovipneumoniae]MDW2930451.1 hypothetical protein [Mesomycoplasma ovipneumoniae]